MSGYDPNQSMLPASGGGNIVAMSGGGLVFANGGATPSPILKKRRVFGKKQILASKQLAKRQEQLELVKQITEGQKEFGSNSKGKGTGVVSTPPSTLSKRESATTATSSKSTSASTASTTPSTRSKRRSAAAATGLQPVLASTASATSSSLSASNPTATASVSTVPTQAAPSPPPSNPIAATTVPQSAVVSAEPDTLTPLTGTSNATRPNSTSTTSVSGSETAPLSATALSAFNPTTAPVTGSLPEQSPNPQTKHDPINDILTTLIGSPSKPKEIYTPEEQDAILKTLAPLLMSDAEKKFEIKMNKITTQE